MDNIINIYTDGSSRGNPGPGGLGVIIEFAGKVSKYAVGYRRTTNNRMELLAAIIGLEKTDGIPGCKHIFSDSRYLVDAVNKGWLASWIKTNFKGKKNPDLWMRFWKLYSGKKVKLSWVKAHHIHPQNNECDKMAFKAASSAALLIDEYYEEAALGR